MIERNALAGGAAWLFILTAGRALAAPEQPAEDNRRQFQDVKTVQIEVRQEYDFPPEGEMDAAGPSGDSARVKKDFLPLLKLAADIVKPAGWKLAGWGAPADVTLRIEVSGTALGAEYTGPTIFGHHYSGARLSGRVTLERDGHELLGEDIEAELPVQHRITRYYVAPQDAPFAGTLPAYCEGLWTLTGRALGPAPLLAGLKAEDSDVQNGAARALLTLGDADTVPAMVELLGHESMELRRVAALGLGVFGDARALAPLLQALGTDTADQPAETDDHGWDLWLEGEAAEQWGDGRSAAREQLDQAGDGLRGAVLWATRQVEVSDKTARLLAALQEKSPPALRANAAVLLRGVREPAVRAALLTALSDAEPAVRAAAAGALGLWSDDQLAGPLLHLTNDAHPQVRRLGRRAIEELQQKRWDAHVKTPGSVPAGATGRERAFVVRALENPDPLVRAEALQLAGAFEAGDILPAVCRMARKDEWPFLRLEALATLVDRHDGLAVETLTGALGDPVVRVRQRALSILAGEASEWEQTTPPPLPEAVLEPAVALLKEGSDDSTGDSVLAVLKRVNGARVAGALEQIARSSVAPRIRGRAVDQLVKTRSARAAPLLLELAAGAAEGEMEGAVGDGLAELNDPATLDPLFALLKSSRAAARRVAVNALGRMRQPRATGPLVAALQAAESSDPAQADFIRDALRNLTGASHHEAAAWRQWWKENAGRPAGNPPATPPQN